MPLSELDPAGPDLTVQEVARYLRVSKTTVYRYLEERLLPGAWLTENPRIHTVGGDRLPAVADGR